MLINNIHVGAQIQIVGVCIVAVYFTDHATVDLF